MDFNFRPRRTDDAELDVTSFMNLMVVLVPVLLITICPGYRPGYSPAGTDRR